MTSFVHREIRQREQDGFSILIPEEYTVRVFGDKLKLSCIDDINQEHRRLRLIINPLEKPD